MKSRCPHMRTETCKIILKIAIILRAMEASISNTSLMAQFRCFFRCPVHDDKSVDLAEADEDAGKHREEYA